MRFANSDQGNEIMKILKYVTCATLSLSVLLSGCTQETQNKLGRAIQNWTGTNGVLDMYAGEKLVMRFVQIDKLTTASATGGGESRAYRFGYGVLDSNQNYVADANEKKIYFEVSDFSTNYVFYENPFQ
jgi:hypothetical protein